MEKDVVAQDHYMLDCWTWDMDVTVEYIYGWIYVYSAVNKPGLLFDVYGQNWKCLYLPLFAAKNVGAGSIYVYSAVNKPGVLLRNVGTGWIYVYSTVKNLVCC